jgi:hypothetical protein
MVIPYGPEEQTMFTLCTHGCRAALLAAMLVTVAPSASQRVSAQVPSPVAVRASLATADSSSPPRRSPIVAGFLGVLPGLGHVYAGETGRGLAVFGVWFASGLVMFSGADRAVTGVGAVVNLGTYVFSIADAALAAERFNARRARGVTF